MVAWSTLLNPYKYCVDSMDIPTNLPPLEYSPATSSIPRIFAFNDRSHEGSTFSHHPCKSQIRTEVSRNGVLLLFEAQVPVTELRK